MCAASAPLGSREVLRCEHCQLVQFRTLSNFCRRCRASLDEEDEPEPAPSPQPVSRPSNGLARTIRSLRRRERLSQRQLAMRMRAPRSFVSKLENQRHNPTLPSLERLARALKVSVSELVSGEDQAARQEQVRKLFADPLIRCVARFLPRLDRIQRSRLLAEVQALTGRRWHER